jgi:hypothetical protein
MSELTFSCGVDLNSIENQQVFHLETSKSANIAIALEQSGVPFSAKYSDSEIIIFYDGSYREEFEEVISKALSDRHDALVIELKECLKTDDYSALLPEIAEALHTTVGTLQAKPLDIQEHLCKAYVDFWQSDSKTLHRELDRIVMVNSRSYDELHEHEKRVHAPHHSEQTEPAAYITREMQKQAAEEVRRQRREAEKRERQRETERNYRS